MHSLRVRNSRRWRDTQLEYDGAVLHYSSYTNAVIRKGHRLVAELCERHAREISHPLTILDVGCGWTDLYEKLDHVIGTYVGIEPARDQILRAQPRPNQFLFRGVGEKTVLRDSCVDIVLHISDLDHCFDAEKVIKETFRVLRPGGKVIILLENRGRLSNGIRRLLGMEISHGEEHLYYFDMDDIRLLCESYGSVDHAQSYGFLLGFGLVSKILPKGFVADLQILSDRLLESVLAKKGQHFIMSVTKKGGDSAVFPLGFICPSCNNSLNWRSPRCNACGLELRWLREDILDVLDDGSMPVPSDLDGE